MAEESRVQKAGHIALSHIRFVIAAVVLIIWAVVGRFIYESQEWEYGMNVFTEMIGIGVTVLIVDELNRRRLREEYKRQLVDDAASISNEIAKNAVHQLRRKGWLEGENGLLKGAYLGGANLQEANLEFANLQGTELIASNLRAAKLWFANLRNADLRGANLNGADLSDADLKGAVLVNQWC